ncbi:hypothetical protein ACJ72_02637 [Emergomyces africanus]|uniref:Uncharacterized protein n=1 Tax=Emergomyces africanus TaxID=1955775 RepID=A0A1B7P1V6_9EURO|nr:hypothetical protein ACJ72_02637 [Emergomyces africanus]
MPDQTEWSVDNLPDILYVFRPTAPQVRSQKTMPMKPSPWGSGLDLRVFDILPDRISTNVEEFRVEAWMRLDRRIQLHDITDRMNPEFRIANNALQQRGVRFRQAFNILSWGSGNKQTKVVEDQLEQKMQARGIDPTLNSTRGLTPGLINPTLGEAGGRVAVPESYGQRFRVFAKEQQELIPQLAMVKQETMLPHTFATQQDMESLQFFMVEPVVPRENMPHLVTGIVSPTHSPNQLATQQLTYAAGMSQHELPHGLILEHGRAKGNVRGSDDDPSVGEEGYVADIVVYDGISHRRVLKKQLDEGEITSQTSDGMCTYISQNTQDSIQSESDDSEMTDIWRNSESDCEGRNWSGSETTIPDAASHCVPIIPLENDICPEIPLYGGSLAVEMGPTTPTKSRVSPAPIELMMEQYIDIPYCWKTEMFEAMRTIQAGMPPSHPNDTLQGQMVADEWELFPSIPGPPCDYLEFSSPREEPTEYERMERATNYQREYDIDIDYYKELRATYGQNFF